MPKKTPSGLTRLKQVKAEKNAKLRAKKKARKEQREL